MEIESIDTDSGPRAKRKGVFDWSLNLGHVFIVVSLFISAAGLYAHDESRISIIETKVDALNAQNLPPRVSALETQAQDLHESLGDIKDVLVQIRNSLDAKADKK